MFELIKGALGVATGLKSLFGKKQKAPSVQDNLLAQAAGARAAAEKYGFNPLTMLQYGNTSGTGLAPSAGPPPLASLEVLASALDQFDPQVKADRERQRQVDQLNLDLAKLKLEQARSGVVIGPAVAPGSVLGNTAVTVSQGGKAGGSYAKGDYTPPNRDHPLADSLGVLGQPDPTIDRGSGLFVGGARWEGAPGWSPGEAIEQEYGDTVVFPELYSFGKFVADVAHNFGRLVTEAEAALLRRKGVPVMKIDGKYYAQQPEKQPLFGNEPLQIPGQYVNMHGATRNRAMGF